MLGALFVWEAAERDLQWIYGLHDVIRSLTGSDQTLMTHHHLGQAAVAQRSSSQVLSFHCQQTPDRLFLLFAAVE